METEELSIISIKVTIQTERQKLSEVRGLAYRMKTRGSRT